jgi:hypothetical protein
MNSKPFLMQYVALLMILVAFMVGAYARRHEPAAIAPEHRLSPSVIVPASDQAEGEYSGDGESGSDPGRLASRLSLQNLFTVSSRSGDRLQTAPLEPLVTLLRSHDLRAIVQVFAPSSNEPSFLEATEALGPEHEFDRALARARIVDRYLDSVGLAPDSYQVVVAPWRSVTQAEVRFQPVMSEE